MTINNPLIEFMAMMRNGQSPEQMVLSLLQQNSNGNPLLQNILSLAQNGREQEIEEIVRNTFATQGVDFNKEFNSFRKFLGL